MSNTRLWLQHLFHNSGIFVFMTWCFRLYSCGLYRNYKRDNLINNTMGKISLTLTIVINVKTRASLAVERNGLLFLCLTHLNNKSNFCKQMSSLLPILVESTGHHNSELISYLSNLYIRRYILSWIKFCHIYIYNLLFVTNRESRFWAAADDSLRTCIRPSSRPF